MSEWKRFYIRDRRSLRDPPPRVCDYIRSPDGREYIEVSGKNGKHRLRLSDLIDQIDEARKQIE